MGTQLAKFKEFRAQCFTTTVPILTPRVAGAALMVSPKTLTAAIIGKLTGEPEHDSQCNCDLCKYRDVKRQAQNDVYTQRAKVTDFVSKIIPDNKHYNDELTDEEVLYYHGWLVENFPELVHKYEDTEGPLYLPDKIACSHKSKIDMTILDIVLQKKRYTFLSSETIEDILKDNESNNGFLDSWSALMTIAEQRKEGEEQGYEAALALDFP